MKHTCHARGCEKAVPPKFLMCLTHWQMVSFALKQAVLVVYRPGQEIDKNPSDDYLAAARAAIETVAAKEAALALPIQEELAL